MYGPPRPCKSRGRSDLDSLPKCIRPLASGLLLQPGHDEIRALRSHIMVRARARFFARAYDAPIDCLVITSSNLAICRPGLRCGGLAPLVESSRSGKDNPGYAGDLRRERHRDLIAVHASFKTVEPDAEPITGSIHVRDA